MKFYLAALLLTLSTYLMALPHQTLHITCADGHRMKVLAYHPVEPATEPAVGVLWIHGGGYITGMASMAGMMGRSPSLITNHGCVVVSPEYRLGRKGRYPNAINDCYEALLYMASHADELGIRADRICVGGESAGGGLCAALCMMARDRGEVKIGFQMPLYPMIDDRDTDTSRDNHNRVWNTRRNHFGWRTYLGDLYGTDTVPVYAAAARQTDYRNLPPCYTFVCTNEPFYRETLNFVEALREAGVPTECDVYQGLYHAFDMLQPRREVSRQAAEAFERAFERLKAEVWGESNYPNSALNR